MRWGGSIEFIASSDRNRLTDTAADLPPMLMTSTFAPTGGRAFVGIRLLAQSHGLVELCGRLGPHAERQRASTLETARICIGEQTKTNAQPESAPNETAEIPDEVEIRG